MKAASCKDILKNLVSGNSFSLYDGRWASQFSVTLMDLSLQFVEKVVRAIILMS
jgi:hypothetical protein